MGCGRGRHSTSATAVLEFRDPGDTACLDQQDDVMDQLHRELFTAVLGLDWTDGVTAAVDLALLGRYYERSPTTLCRSDGTPMSTTTARGTETTSSCGARQMMRSSAARRRSRGCRRCGGR